MLRCFLGLAVGGLLPAAAAACWPCPTLPPVKFEQRTVTNYRTEYRTEYKEVQRTVTRRVPETVMKEVRETVMVPHWREETRQRTVMVPVTRMETRQRAVVRTEWERPAARADRDGAARRGWSRSSTRSSSRRSGRRSGSGRSWCRTSGWRSGSGPVTVVRQVAGDARPSGW